MPDRIFTRRDFLRAAGIGAITPFAVLKPGSASGQTDFGFDADPLAVDPLAPPETAFALSVASGDPTPSGVVLWTRVNPEVYDPSIPLAVEVAADPGFQHVVTGGMVDAIDFGPDRDYTVHLDLHGLLEANRVYFYRFIYQGTSSRVGRCRTLPLPDQHVHRLRLAVLTCQDFSNGYYGALAQVAGEDVDFVVHLGDFIYESGTAAPLFEDRRIVLPSGQQVAVDLADYRALYRKYRTDPFLQMMLEQHTVIIVWDDHEAANDAYWDYQLDTLGAPDHPFSQLNDPGLLRQLKRDSQQAWLEYVPARVAVNPGALHPHDFMRIYRSFRFGDLVELFMTDERTYRTPHPCGEDVQKRYANTGCPLQDDPSGTMLGEIQREWLIDGITGSTANWKVWGNQVFTGALTVGRNPETDLHLNLDAWDGYEFERRTLMQAFQQAGVKNLVVLTGDLHTYLASLLKVDYSNRRARHRDNIVGVEFMTPAVTSSNFLESIQNGALDAGTRMVQSLGPPNRGDRFLFERAIKLTNPHVHFFNSQAHGYSIVEFTRYYTIYTAHKVDKSHNVANPANDVIRKLLVPANHSRFLDLV